MKITFLGTGGSQGIPIVGSNHPVCLSNNPKDKRLRSSIIIEKNKKFILIDCSPDFRYQMLKNNFKKLDNILITHEHYDHIGGLEDIRPISSIDLPIPVYGLERVLKHIQKKFFYVFSENKKNKHNMFSICLHTIKENCDNIFVEKYIKIVPLFIVHGNLNILGFRIDNFAYITDASIIPITTIEKLYGLDLLILNILRVKYKTYYCAMSNTIDIIKKINPKKTFLTHINHMLGFHEDIQKRLPNNVYLAYDGLLI